MHKQGKHNRQEPCEILNTKELYRRENYLLQDYHLVKVGMSEELLRICEENCIREAGHRRKEAGGFFVRRRLRKVRLQERALLAEFLNDLAMDSDSSSFVCEEPIAYFAGREFNAYFQVEYVRHMLRYGRCGEFLTSEVSSGRKGELLSHFVILGQSACVPEIIYECVRNIKSLKWILPERQFRVELQDFVDILYEEYGLAVDVKLLSEKENFTKVHPVCRVPSLVLDFSETDRIPTADVARGSIWLDMASSEEKRRRIEERNTGIYYYSLKKEWKQPQKALYHLDTIGKNGYNT